MVSAQEAMLRHGIHKSALVRRRHVRLLQIDHLIDLRHKSKLDQVQGTLVAVGQRVEGNGRING
jgi:antitoxin HicB